MPHPDQQSSFLVRLMLSSVCWIVSAIALVAGSLMAWSLAHSSGYSDLTALGAALVCGVSPLFLALADWAWRQREPRAVKFTAVISAAVFTAARTASVFGFMVLAIAPQPPVSATQPPSRPVHSNSRVPGSEIEDWLRGTTVAPNKKLRRGTEAARDSSKEVPKPEAPTPIPAAPRWPMDVLAAALGLEPVTLHLAISAVFAVGLESTILMGALGTAVWRTRVVRRHPESEPVTPTVQTVMLMGMAVGLAMGAGRQPAHARTDPRQTAPPWPNPAARGGSTMAHRRQAGRRRAAQEDTTRTLLELLQRGLRGGVSGIEARADGSMRVTNRGLAVLMGRGPGAVNVALHRLGAAGEIALTPNSRGTVIRLRRAAPPPGGGNSQPGPTAPADQRDGSSRGRPQATPSRRNTSAIKSSPAPHHLH